MCFSNLFQLLTKQKGLNCCDYIDSYFNYKLKNSVVLSGVFNARDLMIRGRRRQRKRRWKSKFAFFQSSSWLLQVPNFVKCRWTLQKLNSSEPYPSSDRKRKFRRRLCTPSIQRKTGHFHVVVVQWRQSNVQKSVMHVQNCCFGY